MIGKTKRKLFNLLSKIIDNELSLECLLKYYCNTEKLKLIILNQEERDLWIKLPNFKIEKHLNDIGNISKNYEF